MLPRIENQSSINTPTPMRGQVTHQSSQVFSDLLAGESASAHLTEFLPLTRTTPRPRNRPTQPKPLSYRNFSRTSRWSALTAAHRL